MNQYQFNNSNMLLPQNNPHFNQMMMNNNMFLNQKQFPFYPMIYFFNMPNYMNQNFNQNMMMNNMINANNNMFMNMNNNQMIPNNLNMFPNNMNQFNLNNDQNNPQNKFGNINNFHNQVNNINFEMNNMINMMNNININNNTPNLPTENQNSINTNSMLCMKYSNIFNGSQSSLFLFNYELQDKILEIIDTNTFVNLNKKNLSQNNNNPQMNKEYEKLLKESEMIKNKLNSIFSQDNLSKLIDQKELLNFFSAKEKECIQFVQDNFNGNYILIKFTIRKMKEIFYTSPQISNIVKSVILKINQINIESIQSEEYLLAIINSYFPGIEVPKFLIEEPKKLLGRILFYSERNSETSKYINQVNNKQLMQDSEKLILFLENIQKNKNLIFEGINCKPELFIYFITMNYSIFKKSYFNNEFFLFIKINEEIIKKYISKNFNYSEIYKELNSMTERRRNKKLETLYPIIDSEINNNKDIMFNIIASFYYLLFYGFKLPNNSNGILNIGEPYVNLIFKNFVIYFDKKLRRKIKVKNNFYELLKDLYLSDINDLIKKHLYPRKTQEYSFYDIERIIFSNPKTKAFYLNLREKFIQSGFFSKLGTERDFTYFEKFIKLIPFEDIIFSNTITIFVDGFLNEDSNPIDNWIDFIKYYKIETMFYFFNWPSSSTSKLLDNIFRAKSQFVKATLRASICGKILAYIIYSNTIFKNFQINLVGFSLGNHVIKHCIKELYNLNHNLGNINNPILLTKNDNMYQINLKNVIFIAGATRLKRKYNWKNYIHETIIDKCNNCYTDNDWVLKILYKLAMWKTPIGLEKLNIDYEMKNLVENYDFEKYGFGHRGYKKALVAEKVSGYYIEI